MKKIKINKKIILPVTLMTLVLTGASASGTGFVRTILLPITSISNPAASEISYNDTLDAPVMGVNRKLISAGLAVGRGTFLRMTAGNGQVRITSGEVLLLSGERLTSPSVFELTLAVAGQKRDVDPIGTQVLGWNAVFLVKSSATDVHLVSSSDFSIPPVSVVGSDVITSKSYRYVGSYYVDNRQVLPPECLGQPFLPQCFPPYTDTKMVLPMEMVEGRYTYLLAGSWDTDSVSGQHWLKPISPKALIVNARLQPNGESAVLRGALGELVALGVTGPNSFSDNDAELVVDGAGHFVITGDLAAVTLSGHTEDASLFVN